MFFDDAVDEKYQHVFDMIYDSLKTQYASNPHQGLLNLEKQLEDLYVYEGNDWLGRDDFKSASIAATIAAVETLMVELKEQLSQKHKLSEAL